MWLCTPSSAEVDCCFSSVCLCLPSHSHNAPAAALFNSLLSVVKSFRSSAMANSSLLISFLFSWSNANVHNVLQAFSLSSSVFAFCNIVTRTGMASHCTIYKHNIINDQLPRRLCSRWEGGGYSWEFLLGSCCPVFQILPLQLFQTKNVIFLHPFCDLASKIHTQSQTLPLRNYMSPFSDKKVS